MQDVADVVNLTTAYISNIENNKLRTPPSEDAINRISDTLNLSDKNIESLHKLLDLSRTPKRIKEELYSCREELERCKNIIKNMKKLINEVE